MPPLELPILWLPAHQAAPAPQHFLYFFPLPQVQGSLGFTFFALTPPPSPCFTDDLKSLWFTCCSHAWSSSFLDTGFCRCVKSLSVPFPKSS